MPRDENNDKAKPVDLGPLGKANDNETLGEALSRAGFEPAKVGRRISSQGKRRETLKKRVRDNEDK
ncbi:hypothetical protein [Ensifer adhaerens]|uniref:hypothetical protein n=1 Tax=Ensifer adhaerens TaxID=106592 RepID=UPI001C4E0EE5|nr:hypothetical protein [Ensifer adhaerens]MBW0366697.1 hypothetical protein [Ensifer adhaerens]UCM18360.1 hypothetical protein LDL63_10840 [Ensifer adhaerens]